MPQRAAKSALRSASHQGGKPSKTPPQPGTTDATVRRSLVSLSVGALSLAVIGGLACYTFLLNWGAPGVVAALVGFFFALLARIAFVSLGREWLLAQARRQQQRQQHTSPNSPLDQPTIKR